MGRIFSARKLWSTIRYTRWLLWLAFLGYAVEFQIHRQQHMNLFGQLSPRTEVWMFGLALGAVTAGMLELLMRDKAGIKREPGHKIGFDR
jgi:hypothetical protein